MATTFHSFSDLPAEIRLAIWEMAIAPMTSTPCACADRFVSFERYENPESTSKHDAARPSEDHRPRYLSHDPSASFDFGLWTASAESRQVISKHVLKHAPEKELGKHATLGWMHINGEDIVFDVFHHAVITCFRVPEDECLDVEEALEAVPYTREGFGTRPTKLIAFELDDSWDESWDESWEVNLSTLETDPHVLENLMKMPGSQSAFFRTLHKIIRERLDCRLYLFESNEDACVGPLSECQLQSIDEWEYFEFHSNGDKIAFKSCSMFLGDA
ncbi:hypothetical protein CGCSCA5_v008988 [Colletotrichum siamense]|nr:hypothetical protein CGCSCA5_v008988 [Colletotrichum siamense]